MPETYLRTPVAYESRERRELRAYARTELDSGVDYLLRECDGEIGNGRKSSLSMLSRFFMLIR